MQSEMYSRTMSLMTQGLEWGFRGLSTRDYKGPGRCLMHFIVKWMIGILAKRVQYSEYPEIVDALWVLFVR